MWTVTSWWKPIDGVPNPITIERRSQKTARLEGLHTSCCRGCLRIEVRDPDGKLTYTYDRTDNYWRGEDIPLVQEEEAHPGSA